MILEYHVYITQGRKTPKTRISSKQNIQQQFHKKSSGYILTSHCLMFTVLDPWFSLYFKMYSDYI